MPENSLEMAEALRRVRENYKRMTPEEFRAHFEAHTPSDMYPVFLEREMGKVTLTPVDEVFAKFMTREEMKAADKEADREMRKGERGGLCNRSACLAPGAYWYNRGSLAWYCECCAHLLNRANADVQMADGKPMVIHVPENCSPDEIVRATVFVPVVRG